jgi:methylated-DNA-protein-cysteine methyltransferase related protein
MSNEALEAIWSAVRKIPRGHVSTYGAVARLAGLPGRARLVGHALKVAPAKMRLPWYRVVGAGPRISFPARSRQHAEQSRLLRAEGLIVKGGRVTRRSAADLDELLWKPR